MVNIWKIGAWPGIWEDVTKENKEKFAKKYALKKNFVAIGSAYLPNLKGWIRSRIYKECIKQEDKTPQSAGNRAKQVDFFVNKIEIEDVIVLYMGRGEGYIGLIDSDYYYVKENSKLDFINGTSEGDIAPHRRRIIWEFDRKRIYDINFSWRDAVHKVELEDLVEVDNIKIKDYFKMKLKKSYSY